MQNEKDTRNIFYELINNIQYKILFMRLILLFKDITCNLEFTITRNVYYLIIPNKINFQKIYTTYIKKYIENVWHFCLEGYYFNVDSRAHMNRCNLSIMFTNKINVLCLYKNGKKFFAYCIYISGYLWKVISWYSKSFSNIKQLYGEIND